MLRSKSLTFLSRLSTLGGAWTRLDGVFESATLLAFGDETRQDVTQRLTLDISPRCTAGCRDLRFSLFILDNVRTNPAQVWRNAANPSVPDAALRRRMRDAQGPFRAVVSAPLPPSVQVTLRLPSVALLQVCGRGDALPGAPMDLHALRTAPEEVLLLWSDRNVGTR